MSGQDRIVKALSTMPEEAFGWVVLALQKAWPDALGGFLPESRSSIIEVRAAIDEYLNPKPSFRVVHWNTHHGGVRSDGKLDVQGIANWLVKFKPDIVSLNELEEFDGYGNTDQLEHHRAALEAAQGVPWFSLFCTMSGGARLQGGGVGLLSRWPLDNPLRKGLPAGRPMLGALQPFGALYTTHPSPSSQTDRVAQVRAAIAAQPQGTAIFCGDFNAAPGTVELAPIVDQYKDAWVAASQLGTAKSFIANGITHGSHRIDCIFYRGLEVISCEVPDTRNAAGIFPSDHHPVIATFK